MPGFVQAHNIRGTVRTLAASLLGGRVQLRVESEGKYQVYIIGRATYTPRRHQTKSPSGREFVCVWGGGGHGTKGKRIQVGHDGRNGGGVSVSGMVRGKRPLGHGGQKGSVYIANGWCKGEAMYPRGMTNHNNVQKGEVFGGTVRWRKYAAAGEFVSRIAGTINNSTVDAFLLLPITFSKHQLIRGIFLG